MDDQKTPDPKATDGQPPRQAPLPLAERRRFLRTTEEASKKPPIFTDWASI